MDPRVEITSAELIGLLEFQQEVRSALVRVVELAGRTSESAADIHAEARSIARMLTSLASDLESADAAPTTPQRQLYTHAIDRLEAAESEWRAAGDG
jgi:hypothetical protein